MNDSQFGHLCLGSQDGDVVEPGFTQTHVDPQEREGQEDAVFAVPEDARGDLA